ncbi:MAG: diacylglycerol kinase family lipid kinase [Clostridiaceae bacterium]|nr:diacylglycerol kinase family lipid kinase [Clostridiaceae bacterium]
MLHVFIINPVAGKGRSLQMVEVIRRRFEDFIDSFKIYITERPGHATEIARNIAATGDAVRVYSVGGDGTLNEVVNGIAGFHNVELGIIPCGSGNDVARHLYSVLDPVKLIIELPLSASTVTDLGRLNEKYFINIASVGFDAEVTLNSRYFKRFPCVTGSMSYIWAVLATLIKCRKYKLKIKLDDKAPIEKELLLAIFANGSYYGGGMKAAPSAEMDDGKIDFYLIDSLPRRKILKFFPLFQRGEHESMKEVSLSKGTKATVESDEPFAVNIDGETSLETHITVELLPRYIKVLIPRE